MLVLVTNVVWDEICSSRSSLLPLCSKLTNIQRGSAICSSTEALLHAWMQQCTLLVNSCKTSNTSLWLCRSLSPCSLSNKYVRVLQAMWMQHTLWPNLTVWLCDVLLALLHAFSDDWILECLKNWLWISTRLCKLRMFYFHTWPGVLLSMWHGDMFKCHAQFFTFEFLEFPDDSWPSIRWLL